MQSAVAAKMGAGTGISAVVEVGDLEREIEKLVRPEFLLPSQIGAITSQRVPEIYLVLSVLDQAVHEYLVSEATGKRLYCRIRNATARYDKVEKRLQEESAKRWIFEDESIAPWSFDWCCHVLGFEPEWVRRKVRELAPAARAVRRRMFLTKIGIRGSGPAREIALNRAD